MEYLGPTEAKCLKCEVNLPHPKSQTSQLIKHLSICDPDSHKHVKLHITEKNERNNELKKEKAKKGGFQGKISNFNSKTL